MTKTESEVLESLNSLMVAVGQMGNQTEKPDLQAMFARIDQQTDLLPDGTHPALLHYLQKKSYEKARLFLLGRDGENASGNCHGHRVS
jgi:hypothetical protein